MFFLLFVFYFFEPRVQGIPVPILGRTAASTGTTITITNRSMFSIVWSCISTVILCAWVSVHPNVPPRSQRGALLRRLKMMVWTIIAPELVLAWAVRQWFGARLVAERYKNHGWTMSHGHFLVMGGFTLVSANVTKPKKPSGAFSFDDGNRHDGVEEPGSLEELRQWYEQEKRRYEEAKQGYEQEKKRYDEEKPNIEKEKRRYEQGQQGENERRQFEGERQRFEDYQRRYDEGRRQYKGARRTYEEVKRIFEERRRRYEGRRRRYEERWNTYEERRTGSIQDQWDQWGVVEEQWLLREGQWLQEEGQQFQGPGVQVQDEGQRFQEEEQQLQEEGQLYEDEREQYEAERRRYEEEILRNKEKRGNDEADRDDEQRQYEEERRRYEEERRQYEEHYDSEKVQHYNRRLRQHDAMCRLQQLGVLSFDHFCELVRDSRIDFPTITVKEIKDRSKADFLSKTLAILQTTWFLVQCGARGVQGLALTELELVTLALASLNAVTYVFWWHKPLGVQEPVQVYLKTLKDGPLLQAEVDQEIPIVTVRRVMADIRYAFWMIGEVPGSLWSVAMRIAGSQGPGLNVVFLVVNFSLAIVSIAVLSLFGIFLGIFPLTTAFLLSVLKTHRPTRESYSEKRPIISRITYALRKIHFSTFAFFSRRLADALDRRIIYLFYFRLYTVFPFIFVILVVVLVFLFPVFTIFFLVSFLFNAVFGIITTDTIRPSAAHVPAFYALKTNSDRYSRMLVFGSFGVIFGGLHCIGWHFVYPTLFEQTLWRSTSLAITGIPFIVALIDFFLVNINKYSTHRTMRMASFILEVIMITLLFVYVPSRLSLIAQALALMRNQPPSAFVAVNWTKYFPHFLSS